MSAGHDAAHRVFHEGGITDFWGHLHPEAAPPRATTPDDELAEKASRVISEMCKGDRWRMCIPVQPDDSDVILGTLVRRFNELRAGSPSRESGALLDAFHAHLDGCPQCRNNPFDRLRAPTGTFACPICGVAQPHDHDPETKTDWATSPWLVRARRAVGEESFERFMRATLFDEHGRLNPRGDIGMVFRLGQGVRRTAWDSKSPSNPGYDDLAVRALWSAWDAAVRETIAAVRAEEAHVPLAGSPSLETLERDAARMREALEKIAKESRPFGRPYGEEPEAFIRHLRDIARAALTPSGEPTTTPETSE